MIDLETGEVIPVFLRTPFNYDRDAASLQSGLRCDDPTRTQQQFAEECDINTIVERFGLTGELPESPRIPLPEDFLEITDYRSALDAIREADQLFMSYPAPIRERFGNDAGRFVEFVQDPANVDQVREWGLARPVQPPQAPIAVQVIPTVPEGTPSAPAPS